MGGKLTVDDATLEISFDPRTLQAVYLAYGRQLTVQQLSALDLLHQGTGVLPRDGSGEAVHRDALADQAGTFQISCCFTDFRARQVRCGFGLDVARIGRLFAISWKAGVIG